MAKVLEATFDLCTGQQVTFEGQPEVLSQFFGHHDIEGKAIVMDALLDVIIPYESIDHMYYGYTENEDPEPEPVADAFCEVES